MSTNSTQHELRADVVLPMPADEARERLETRLHGGRHGDAIDAAVPVRLVVGPSRETRIPGKEVRGEVLPPHEHGNSLVYPLHWEAVGLGAAAYPALQANIAITPIDDSTSLLSFLGHYTPPLGAFGELADRAAMSRVAAATAESVVNRLAHVIRETPVRAVRV